MDLPRWYIPLVCASLAGIAAVISVDFLRPLGQDRWAGWVLGWAPNGFAAVALTLLVFGVGVMAVAASGRRAGARGLQTIAAVAAALAVIGLVGWELQQRTIEGMVFDRADLLATLGGCALTLPMIGWVTRWTWR